MGKFIKQIVFITKIEILRYLRRSDTFVILWLIAIIGNILYFFWYGTSELQQLDLIQYFRYLNFALCFFIPTLCQRSWTREYQSGTQIILAQFPTSVLTVLVSKLLAATLVSMSIVVPASLLCFTLTGFGDFNRSLFFCGLFGIGLTVLLYVAVSQSVAVWLEGPARSLVAAIGILLISAMLGTQIASENLSFIVGKGLAQFINSLSNYYHTDRIFHGLLDSRALFNTFLIILCLATMSFKKVKRAKLS